MSRFSPDRDLKIVGGTAQSFFWRLVKVGGIILLILYALGSV
uniref:Uncharacterized protein n=1 Tax=viral metagenome TaxID=1070528 RepID=A0A6M3Y5P9_9ZZZZ